MLYHEEKNYYSITSDIYGQFSLPENLDKTDDFGYVNGVLGPACIDHALCEVVYERYSLKRYYIGLTTKK